MSGFYPWLNNSKYVTEWSIISIERILDLSAIPPNMGDEPRTDISA
jgi:hypothetical protein